jgi:mannose-6-phosphate isomerase-like protein (cupin superfamily)
LYLVENICQWHWTNLGLEKQNRPTLQSHPTLPLIFLRAAAIGDIFWFSHTVSKNFDREDHAMKLRFGTRSWLIAARILIALFSGPAVVASVWLLAAIAAEAGFVVLPDSAPRFAGPQGREADVTELVATRDQTGGALGLFRQTIAPKSGPPMHIHQTEDEFFYVVSGQFKVKLGDRIMSAPAQSVMFVPRGTAHTFQNVGTEPGVLLVGVTPGGFEKVFEERQGVDAETLRALVKKHNMEVVGPPLQ